MTIANCTAECGRTADCTASEWRASETSDGQCRLLRGSVARESPQRGASTLSHSCVLMSELPPSTKSPTKSPTLTPTTAQPSGGVQQVLSACPAFAQYATAVGPDGSRNPTSEEFSAICAEASSDTTACGAAAAQVTDADIRSLYSACSAGGNSGANATEVLQGLAQA